MKGFSLVELMLVLAIMAILGALAYPGYAAHVRKARRTEAQVALIEALQEQERYYAQHHRYLAFSADAPDPDGRLRWWSGARAQDSSHEIDAHACDGQPLTACVELRAQPGTARVNAGFTDTECGALTVSSDGGRGASGPHERCWP